MYLTGLTPCIAAASVAAVSELINLMPSVLQQLLQEESIQMGPEELHSITNDRYKIDEAWIRLMAMAEEANIDASNLKTLYAALEQPLLDIIKQLRLNLN